MQHLGIHGFGALVGSREAIASLVDLSLGERLDYQQMSNCVARLAQLTMRGNDFRMLDHAPQPTA